MKIKFIKDTKDIRENRDKTILKGTELIVTDELGNKYIKAKAAINVKDVKPDIEVIKNIEEAKAFEENQNKE